MSKEFAEFMDTMREEPLEKQIDQISDILTKVMAIVVSAIDDLTQKMAVLQNQQIQMSRDIQELKSRPVAAAPATGKPIVSPATGSQAPAVKAAPKPAPKPLSPMSARSAINSELKALFSRRKKG